MYTESPMPISSSPKSSVVPSLTDTKEVPRFTPAPRICPRSSSWFMSNPPPRTQTAPSPNGEKAMLEYSPSPNPNASPPSEGIENIRLLLLMESAPVRSEDGLSDVLDNVLTFLSPRNRPCPPGTSWSPEPST